MTSRRRAETVVFVYLCISICRTEQEKREKGTAHWSSFIGIHISSGKYVIHSTFPSRQCLQRIGALINEAAEDSRHLIITPL